MANLELGSSSSIIHAEAVDFQFFCCVNALVIYAAALHEHRHLMLPTIKRCNAAKITCIHIALHFHTQVIQHIYRL